MPIYMTYAFIKCGNWMQREAHKEERHMNMKTNIGGHQQLTVTYCIKGRGMQSIEKHYNHQKEPACWHTDFGPLSSRNVRK